MPAKYRFSLDGKTIRGMCGDIADRKGSAIATSGADLMDVEVTLVRLAGEDDLKGDVRHLLSGFAPPFTRS